MAKKKEV
jgi:hypothetical protein